MLLLPHGTQLDPCTPEAEIGLLKFRSSLGYYIGRANFLKKLIKKEKEEGRASLGVLMFIVSRSLGGGVKQVLYSQNC